MTSLVVFDVNGTLLDPGAIDRALALDDRHGLGVDALDDAVGQSMVDALAGAYRPFSDYLEAALRRRLTLAGHDLARLDAALQAAQRMPAFPDAAAALDRLRAAGFRIAALTNSPRAAAEQSLDAAGLLASFDELTGSDEAETYKPSPRMYELALTKGSVSAADAWMVAAHGWDLLGAKRAGLRTAWIAAKERILLDTVPRPDVSGASLTEVAEAIVGTTRS